jgi:hypothetical protein
MKDTFDCDFSLHNNKDKWALQRKRKSRIQQERTLLHLTGHLLHIVVVHSHVQCDVDVVFVTLNLWTRDDILIRSFLARCTDHEESHNCQVIKKNISQSVSKFITMFLTINVPFTTHSDFAKFHISIQICITSPLDL